MDDGDTESKISVDNRLDSFIYVLMQYDKASLWFIYTGLLMLQVSFIFIYSEQLLYFCLFKWLLILIIFKCMQFRLEKIHVW